ncbi:MAG: ferritin family protein [Rubrivivax sp.]|nr:ferritin family protein [Rubrivivax sp.]
MSPRPAPPAAPGTPQTIEELMLQALAIEREAVARYEELADMMATHNNREVAGLFRQMAGYERHHVEHILSEMGWAEDMVAPRRGGMWTTPESPEAVPIEEMHYLMHPWHALQLALAAERRAQGFFAMLAASAGSDGVRRAAEQMRDEEAEHVALVESWLARVQRPADDWAVDPDPPRYID